jgi:hypothetical protein
MHTFDDLDRREMDMNNVANMLCPAFVSIDHALAFESVGTNGFLPENPFGENSLSTNMLNVIAVDLMPNRGIPDAH